MLLAKGLLPALLHSSLCVLLLTHRSLAAWNGDILGRTGVAKNVEASASTAPTLAGAAGRSKATEDHARFYSAADALTKWAEATFALTAKAHKELQQQPNGVRGSACVYDGTQCLFNPYTLDFPGFPQPEHLAETMLKHFTEQAFTCRNATDNAGCHLDPLCDWDARTDTCFLARDLHADMQSTIKPCDDLLYSPLSENCWRRTPEPHSSLPCGDTACKLFPAGSGAVNATMTAAGAAAAAAGTPEDRCMLAAEVRHMGVSDVYELMKARYGDDHGGALTGGAGELRRVGFGSCPTAPLHHALTTECRAEERAACVGNKRCSITTILMQEFCVLAVDAAVELLLGSTAFTRTVMQTEAACAAASSSRDDCLAVPLALPANARARAARRAVRAR